MIVLLTCFLWLLPQNEVELSIRFSGPEHSRGKVYVEIRNDKNEVMVQEILSVKDSKAMGKFQLARGIYAVSAFYDSNNNGKLDKNFLGVPTEKYGFSNNARGTFGPPELKAQLVDLQSSKQIDIELK